MNPPVPREGLAPSTDVDPSLPEPGGLALGLAAFAAARLGPRTPRAAKPRGAA
ncbi:MAG TPA: hypothetical protein VKB65_00950 [Myxococcota bacterium]|nr:hypothetical protein [Myxococcota bacterium]